MLMLYLISSCLIIINNKKRGNAVENRIAQAKEGGN